MASRTGAVLAMTVAIAAVIAPRASAGPRVDYKQMYPPPLPGKSTGSDTRLFYKNPNDAKAKPIPVRREEFTFPAGTAYDESVVPDCTASDAEIRLFGKAACPAASWIGGSKGDTSMSGLGPGEEDALDVDAWDDHGVVVVFGRSHDFPEIGAIARGHRVGQTITFDLER